MNEENEDMVYVVSNINKFVDETRKIVFGCFGEGEDITDDTVDLHIALLDETDIEELNKTLSRDECLAIVHSHVKPKKTKKGHVKYIISEQKFEQIIEDFNARLVSNLLISLVNKGLIESAYDEESNDFVFWVKENDTTDNS